MKILWHSNAPWVPSGYGTQTRRTVPILRKLGVDVDVSAFYGLEHGPVRFEGSNVYGNQWSLADPFGSRSLACAAETVHPDLVVALMDIWAVPRTPLRVVPWFPIDHEGVPDRWIQGLPDRWDLLGVSEHSTAAVRRVGFDIRTIPHTVPCDVFRPLSNERERSPIGDRSCFTFAMVAANSPTWQRKAFSEVLQAVRILRERTPRKFQLYLHAFPSTPYQSIDLGRLAVAHDVADLVAFLAPSNLMFGFPDDSAMCQLYNWFDVLLQPSYGEGFCLPVVEAQSCGIPVITQDVTSLSEVTRGGVSVQSGRRVITPEFGVQFAPDPEILAEAMLEMMEADGSTLRRMGEVGRDHVEQQYDTPVAEALWGELLEVWDNRIKREAEQHEVA